MKQVINIKKKTVPFRCFNCKMMVDVNQGTPMVIENDKSIINTWDYGHQHKKVYEILNKKLVVTEDS